MSPTSHSCNFYTILLTVCTTFFLLKKWAHISTATVSHLTPKHPFLKPLDLYVPCYIKKSPKTNSIKLIQCSTHRPTNTDALIFTPHIDDTLCEIVCCYLSKEGNHLYVAEKKYRLNWFGNSQSVSMKDNVKTWTIIIRILCALSSIWF